MNPIFALEEPPIAVRTEYERLIGYKPQQTRTQPVNIVELIAGMIVALTSRVFMVIE